jgi:capsular polysaccharide biosynthesis protein
LSKRIGKNIKMTLKKIFKIINKEKKLIISIIVFSFFITIIPIFLINSKYEINFSLLISQTKTQETNEFKYDTYYALKAKDEIGNYVIGLLKSPEQINKILINSKLDLKDFTPYNFRIFFRSFKISSQSIGIIFYLENPQKSSAIVKNTTKLINQEIEKTYQPNEKDTVFQVKATDPLIFLRKKHILLNFILVFIVSFIIAILIVLFKEYLKD